MIPADRFTLNDDDTAWHVFEGGRPLTGDLPYWAHHDRPCATCGGPEAIEADGWVDAECFDCIDGRHTFDIEVVLYYGRYEDRPTTNFRTYRVSIVPGMVLPIRPWRGKPTESGIYVNSGECSAPALWMMDDDRARYLGIPTLPPATGMWAVKLRVA